MFPLRIDRGKRTKWRRISIKTIKVKPSAAKCHPNRPKWAPDAFKIRPKCSQTQSKTERSLEEREKKKKKKKKDKLHHQTETIKSVLIEREVENQIKTNWERNCWGEKGKDKKEKKEKKEKRERETITNDGLNKQQ